MTGMCPHCGYNLARDVPIERDGWLLKPGAASRDGERVDVSPQQATFLHTLAKAAPHPLRPEVIGNRLTASDNPKNLANVVAFNIRKRLAHAPFETVYGYGYRWAA